MIEKMTKYSFVMLSADKEEFLSKLQELGLVDITRSEKPVDERSQNLLASAELRNGLIKGLRNADIPEGTEPVEYGKDEDVERIAGGTLMLYNETRQKVADLQKELDSCSIWGNFDHSVLETLAGAGAQIHFHRIAVKRFLPEWEDTHAITEIGRDKSNVYFVVAGEDGLPGEIPVPEKDAAKVGAELEQAKADLRKYEGEILALRERIPELEAASAKAITDLDRYLAGVAASTAAEDKIVVMEGFCPEEKVAAADAFIEQSKSLCIKEDANVEDNPPIEFRNNKFVKMFEVLTDMYGRPAYNGFDPTPYIAIFFMLFFAFCMGDAGYGLILIALGLGMKKMLGDLAPLVTTLGVATTVIGFLFHTFFSMDIAQWQIFAPIKGIFLPAQIAGYDGTMVLSLVVGIVHLSIAMIVKTYMATKQNGFLGSLGVWGWTLLIVGGVVVGTFALLGVLDKDITKIIVIVLGVVSALGIFLFNDIHRNPLANIGSGLWEAYNTVTGLLGDVLSYLRLYALGLAGSMLGKAFNDIGLSVLGDGSAIALWIPFLLIVLVGHVLNIAMAALGAFVHPLRLNFLEFFKNSGYDAAGRSYNPLKK